MSTATRLNAKFQRDEVKNAYQVWLKDLYNDKPEKLLQKLDKKRGRDRQTKRKQRLQHAQRHTSASSLKDVALNKVERPILPAISRIRTPDDQQALQDSQNRRQQALAEEANYSSLQYAYQPSWRPGLAFFQQLVCHLLYKTSSNNASQSRLSEGIVSAELVGFPVRIAPILLRVPIRRNKNESCLGVALLFCQERNQEQQQQVTEANEDLTSIVLHCRVYMRVTSWQEQRATLLDILSNSSAEICAVTKSAEDLESRHNKLDILCSRKQVDMAIDALWVDPAHTHDISLEHDSELLAVQRYIPFKGALSNALPASSGFATSIEGRAWIARCASRKRDKKSSTVWIISGGDVCAGMKSSSIAITNSRSKSCQFVKCSIDQAWAEPRLLASMCATALERVLRIRFNELVVDLQQDTSGTWWLLQVKAFTLASNRPASAAIRASSLSKASVGNLSRTQSAPTQFETSIGPISSWKKWRCAGRYCITKSAGHLLSYQQSDEGNVDDNNEPCGHLTKKMLRSCEFYDDFVQQQDMSLAGGFSEFQTALSFHLQHRLSKRDRSQLYEPQPLCSACLKQYHSLRQQWIAMGMMPEYPAASNIRARDHKKKAFSRMQTESMLLHPRMLPSLCREFDVLVSLGTSQATSTIPASNVNTSTKSSSKEVSTLKQPKYLAELTAMEEMLAEHEPISSKPKSNVSTLLSSDAMSIEPPHHEDIFPKWDGISRVEEMWQNLSFKPLEANDPDAHVRDSGGKKEGYNSISLQQELTKSICNDDTGQCTYPDIHDKEKFACVKPVAAHTVHVQQCRRVFEDEPYRENLVNDALSALRLGKSNVYFVVTPKPQNATKCQQARDDEDEVAELALRSLYIDVKQGIAASSDDLASCVSLSSWPMRPQVSRETSGSLTVRLGQV